MAQNPRDRTLFPLLVPLGIFLGMAVVLYAFSRILLHVPKQVAVVVALMTALNVLVTCAIVSMRKVKGPTLGLLALVIAVPVLLGAGTAAKIFKIKEPKPKPTPVAAQEVTVIAKGTAFDAKTLSAKPGDLKVTFKNEETSPVQHNMQFFAGPDATAPLLLNGAIIGPGASATYQLTGLKEGSYFYRCIIHPTVMTGTLTVSGSGGGSSAAGSGPVQLVAQNLSFDKKDLSWAANTPTQVILDNKDSAVHNFSIVSGPPGFNKPAGVAAIANPGSKVTYDEPALPAGTYKFQCDIHPALMFGTLTVTGGPGGGAPTATASTAPTATASTAPTSTASTAPTATATSPPASSPPTATASPAAGAAPPVQLSAANIAFNTKTITIKAGTPTQVVLKNADAAPHNFDIVSGPAGYTKPAAIPTIANPGSTVTYPVPALPAGTYQFQCDLHPAQMNGTLTVQ